MAQSLEQFKAEQAKLSSKRLKSGEYPNELIIVSEGDSWFDYPLKKDVIDYLIKMGYAVDNNAKGGDTLENMIYGSGYKKTGDVVVHKGPISFQKTLNSVREFKPKIVLFSGGGNDIVGSEILGYLNHKYSSTKELINKTIFQARLSEMKRAIEHFIKAVYKTYRGCNILMDGYDYARVNGKGYTLIGLNVAGPWILPSMGMKAITEKKDQERIIKYLVDEFNGMLSELDDKYSYFHHIDLRGKFPDDSQWHNEIHLKNTGYKQIAYIYHTKITSILGQDPIAVNEEAIIA